MKPQSDFDLLALLRLVHSAGALEFSEDSGPDKRTRVLLHNALDCGLLRAERTGLRFELTESGLRAVGYTTVKERPRRDGGQRSAGRRFEVVRRFLPAALFVAFLCGSVLSLLAIL